MIRCRRVWHLRPLLRLFRLFRLSRVIFPLAFPLFFVITSTVARDRTYTRVIGETMVVSQRHIMREKSLRGRPARPKGVWQRWKTPPLKDPTARHSVFSRSYTIQFRDVCFDQVEGIRCAVSATRCQSCDFIWRATRSDFFPTQRRERRSPRGSFLNVADTMLHGIHSIDRLKNISFSSESLENILNLYNMIQIAESFIYFIWNSFV